MVRCGLLARFAVLALSFTVLVSSAALPSSAQVTATVAASYAELRVMTFNIEYGGTVIDFDSIVEAAVRSHADVIALNEAYAHVGRLAREAGYPYVSRRTDVISKYPLIDPPGANGRYQFVQLAPGQVVAVANVHLASNKYGPRLVMDGWTRKHVLSSERKIRLPGIRPFVRALEGVVDSGIPSIILGDFNAPSHEDWRKDMVGVRPQIRYPVRWPVSLYMARNGYLDSFREAHPKVRAAQGLTWPAARPRSPDSWNPRKKAPHDRIDQIWWSGSARAVGSRIVGERDGPGVGIEVHPWGSDHRGVVSTLAVTPGAAPVMVSVDPRLANLGTDVTATYRAPGNPGEQVAVVPSGGDPATDAIDRQATPSGHDVNGSIELSTSGWAPGGYDAVLLAAAGTELSRFAFWVRTPGAPPELDTSTWRYEVGEPIEVTWSGAPGYRFDWLGLYARGADPLVAYYKAYVYTRTAVVGTERFDDDAVGRWPMPPGRYTVYYLLNDNYHQVASADFVIHG